MTSFPHPNKLLHDTTGAVLVETAIVVPLFFLLVLGTIDVTYMFYQWALADKATYVGARTAVVSSPVAKSLSGKIILDCIAFGA